MLATTKPRWSASNLRADLAARLGVPVGVDTDNNAAAVAQQRFGAGAGCAERRLHDLRYRHRRGPRYRRVRADRGLHREVGHVLLVRVSGDIHVSICPYHPDCAAGLASGHAIAHRLPTGQRLADAPEVAARVADYLGQLVAAIVLLWSPHRVVRGGGVLATTGLLAAAGAALGRSLGDYGTGTALAAPGFLVPAALADAGLEGALLTAREIGGVP